MTPAQYAKPLDRPIHASTVGSLVTQISGESEEIRARVLEGLRGLICLHCGGAELPCTCQKDD